MASPSVACLFTDHLTYFSRTPPSKGPSSRACVFGRVGGVVNPPMLRILERLQHTPLAGQGPQIVQTVAWRRRHRVVAIRQQNRIAVADTMDQRLACRRVQLLVSEAVRRLDAKVVHLLESRLTVGAVVLMRWITAPMTWRVERLAEHQALDNLIVDQDVVHFARV